MILYMITGRVLDYLNCARDNILLYFWFAEICCGCFCDAQSSENDATVMLALKKNLSPPKSLD